MDKAEGLKVLMALAEEYGIPYIFFETKQEAEQLLKDMRYGHYARKKLDSLGIKIPEPRLF